MKHIICFSGGHSSAHVAMEVAEKFGKENVILLNHDINSRVENEDVKRFKKEVAEAIGVEITFANMKGFEEKDQFDVSIEAKAFRTKNIPAICTSRLKTQPFMEWLKLNATCEDIIYYGFDKDEIERIDRRKRIMKDMGYETGYPLAEWSERKYKGTEDLGVRRPLQYEHFKHANCIGCIKGGKQHWYVVYCTRPDIFKKAKESEEIIGFSILKERKKPIMLKELECTFDKMRRLGVEPTEHIPFQRFWADVAKLLKEPSLENYEEFVKPCMCTT